MKFSVAKIRTMVALGGFLFCGIAGAMPFSAATEGSSKELSAVANQELVTIVGSAEAHIDCARIEEDGVVSYQCIINGRRELKGLTSKEVYWALSQRPMALIGAGDKGVTLVKSAAIACEKKSESAVTCGAIALK